MDMFIQLARDYAGSNDITHDHDFALEYCVLLDALDKDLFAFSKNKMREGRR